MELNGKLKEKADQAENKTEKEERIKEAGAALTDDELEKVAGGGQHPRDYYRPFTFR